MYPHPDVTQHQGDTDKQEPQGRVAGRGADAGFTELAVAGLNTKARAVHLINPVRGGWADAPDGVHEGLAAMALMPTTPVPAVNADGYGGPPVGSVGQGIARPDGALLGGEDARTTGTPRIRRL